MSRRLGFLLGFAALAAVLGVIGYVIGADLAVAKAHRYVEEIIITHPREPRGVQITTALLFAWPAVVAGMACAIHRWRRDEDPSLVRGLAYFAIPLGVIGGMHVASWLMLPMPTAAGLPPMLSLSAFAPTKVDAQLAALTAIVLWLYIWVRPRDR